MSIESKFKRVKDYYQIVGSRPPNGFEVYFEFKADYRVIVGVGLRMHPGKVTTMRLGARRLDPNTGMLGPIEYYTDGDLENFELEQEVTPTEAPLSENHFLAGFGCRAANRGDVTTLVIWGKSINNQGQLDNLEEFRVGEVPNFPLEELDVHFIVPDPYIIVSIGLRAKPGNITTLKGLYGKLVPRE